jgi:hypothetical protein
MQPNHRLVVTLAPELLTGEAALAMGERVTVAGGADQALEFLLNHVGDVRVVVADLGELGDRWTGMRLLKHLRGRSGFEEAAVWLMASRWDAMLLQWATGAGAAGLTKRSLRGLQKALASSEPGAVPGIAEEGEVALRAAVARERSDTDKLLRALGLEPAAWRAADGALHVGPLVRALSATAGS